MAIKTKLFWQDADLKYDIDLTTEYVPDKVI